MAITVYNDEWILSDRSFFEEHLEDRKAAKAFRKGRDLLVVSDGGYDNTIFLFHWTQSAGFTLLIQPDMMEDHDVGENVGYAYPRMKNKSDLLADVAGDKLDLLIMTASFLGDAKFKEALQACPPDYVIVDCAETLIDESLPHHRQYRKIPKLIQSFQERPAIFANTHTWRKQDLARICLALGMQDWKTFKAPKK